MGDSDIIKEFLVSVGFKIDEQTLNKFGGVMGQIGGKVLALAEVLVTTAAAVETFVTVVATKMEDLYWSSQRLGSSVGAIQDYALGIKNLGGTAEGARSSLENLARLIRTNPGFGALAHGLSGVSSNDPVKIMEGLGNRFKSMPYFIAARYAEMLGIDEQTLWAMVHAPRGGAGARTFTSMYAAAGLDPEKAALGMKNFMIQVRDLEAEFTVLAQILATYLEPVAKGLIEWTQEGAKWIAKEVGEIKPEEWKEWSNTLKELATNVKDLAGNLGGLAKTLGDLYGTLNKLAGGHSIFEDLNNLVKSTSLWVRALSLDLKSLNDAMKGDWGAAWADFKASSAAERAAFANDTGGGKPAPAGKVKPGRFGTDTSDAINAAGSSMWNRIIGWFQRQGWTGAQAAGIAANLQGENWNLNPMLSGDRGTAFGIGQWHADRQANFARFAGHSIQNSTRDEQLAFVQWELTHTEAAAGRILRAARTAAEAGAVVAKFYERPRNTARDSAHRAAVAQRMYAIHQKTDIHVNGSGPGATTVARDVAAQQTRVNGDLLRNLKGVVQ